jgi:hypothetical protein
MLLHLPDQICDAHMHFGTAITGIDMTYSLKTLCRLLDKYHLSRAAISSLSQKSSILKLENRTLLKYGKRNRALYPLLRTEPSNYLKRDVIADVRKNLQNRLIFGIKVNASIDKVPITSRIYNDVLSVLDDEEAVLLLHCGRWECMSGWKYGVEIAGKYPHLEVILAHMGGNHPDHSYKAIRAAKKYPNVYLDTSQVMQPEVLRRALKTVGASRILFGSDVPWGGFLQNITGVVQAFDSEKTIRAVTHDNFCHLFKK